MASSGPHRHELPRRDLSRALVALSVPVALALVPRIALAEDPPATGLEDLPRPGDVRVFNGVPAQNCQWPMVVGIGSFSICTATLVHPQVLTTASHCLEGGSPSTANFGESSFGPARSVPIDFCKLHPDYPGSSGGGLPSGADDAAFCVLSQPVAVPTTPIPFGCELAEVFPGQDRVALVGYGNNNGGSGPGIDDDTGAGTKRYGASSIAFYDQNNNTITAGDGMSTTCQGDSGGPVMVRLEGGTSTWRNMGMLSTGVGDCGGGQQQANYMQTPYYLDWLETESGHDLTPCWDDQGNWAPTEACGGFSADPLDTSVSWNNWCDHQTGGPENTCGPSYADPPDTVAPVVTIVSPANQTQYDGAPATVDIDVDIDEQWPMKSVRLLVNGEDAGSLKGPEFTASADFPQGTYTLTVVASDWSGNQGTSNAINIGVGVAPEPGGETGGGGGDMGDAGDMGDVGDVGDAGGTDGNADGGGGGGDGCSVAPEPAAPRGLALLGLGALALAGGLTRRRRR